ncbi:hypothetical protein BDZ89DRAFT_1037908 [Hymenopellis radicata]|nr:hypothetical protein BDZ89DRAFT_1037908 [Hymenopellis radicata]
MSALKSPNKLFQQAKGHMVMKNRGNQRIPTRHVDLEGTVNISFTHDGDTPGLIIRESISWDGETDTTRFVPCPVERSAKQRTRAPMRGRDDVAHAEEGEGEGDEA